MKENTNVKLWDSTYRLIPQKKIALKIIFVITEIRLMFNFLFGFRWPSAYVLSNNVFTYDFGFLPRALVASGLKIFFGDHIYSLKFLYILIIGTALLILFFFMYMSYYFSIKSANIIGSVLILWYSLSIYSAYLSHEAGYFEQYAYVILCILILFSDKVKSDFLFTFLCAVLNFVCLLISETNAFLICPVLIMMSLIRLLRKTDKKESNRCEKSRIKNPLFKSVWIVFLFNLPNLIYCLWTGLILVPKDRVLKQLELIRSHAGYFERLDEIGGYFYSGSRRPESYTGMILFRVWNWQLKGYLLLIIFTVMMVLILMKQYQKTLYYTIAVGVIMLCVYCLNFIAWDTDRYKFCAAMAVTLFSIWILKETNIKEFIVNKEIIYIIVAGTAFMFMIMDFRLGLFDGAVYNDSLKQLVKTLHNTWRINY